MTPPDTAVTHIRHSTSEQRLTRTSIVIVTFAGVALLAAPSLHTGAREAEASQAPAFLPDTVEFTSGSLRLRGLIWRPRGNGPFPAILFNHGSGTDTYENEMAAIGPYYAAQGRVLFWPYRRGQGLSAGRGEAIVTVLDRIDTTSGSGSRARRMAELLSTEQLQDQLSALAFLKQQRDVDSTRIAVQGNSFGGILAVFMAERAPGITAVVASAPAAQTWSTSPELRQLLIASARNARVPVFFLQASNDYDLSPSRVLSEEMERAGRMHLTKVYPAFGSTVAEGHSFGYYGSSIWGADVRAFLDAPTARH